MELRYHQIECLEQIKKHFTTEDKGLIKMFCGSGKSLIIYNCLLKYTIKLSIIVVPSINLITQFNKDYLHNENTKLFNQKTFNKNYETLSICSRNEYKNDLDFTTDEDEILDFINKDGLKIILVTYQSLNTVINVIEQNDIEIDLMCFDEAHHILGNGVKEMLFGENYDEDNEFLENDIIAENILENNNNVIDEEYEEGNFLSRFVKKTLFFTATPKNSNGIKMHETILGCETNEGYLEINNDYDNESICYNEPDCGSIIYEYKHTDGVRDNILNDFNIRIDLFTETAITKNTENNLLETPFD